MRLLKSGGNVEAQVSDLLCRQMQSKVGGACERFLTARRTRREVRGETKVIRLPEAIESMTVLRGGLQSIRRTDTFSGYRRFLGTGRIVKEP